MRNPFFPVLGRGWPTLRTEPEEWFTPTKWMPPVDIEEDDREYVLKAELPGMKKEDVKLKVGKPKKQWKPRATIAMNTGTRRHKSARDYKRVKRMITYE